MACQIPKLESANDSNDQMTPEEMKNFIFTQLEKEFKCALCHNIICKATTISCSHIFCYNCILPWNIDGVHCCPVCKTDIESRSSFEILDSYITSVCDFMGGEIKKQRHEMISERNLVSHSWSIIGSQIREDCNVCNIHGNHSFILHRQNKD